MRKLLTILAIFVSQFALGQNIHSNSNSKTIEEFKGGIKADNGIINGRFPDTAAANLTWVKNQPGIQIIVGNTIYLRDQTATKWLIGGATGGSALTNGLVSIGGITLVDSTVTLVHDIVWGINGSTFTRSTDTSFVIHTADSGYYRRDLIYADNSGVIHLLVGTPDTSRAVTPPLPSNSIQVTTVDVYGANIANPIPTIIGTIPNLQQVTDVGDTTTNPLVLINNTIQTPVQVLSDANRGNYLYFRNANSGSWAGSGFEFKNDYPGATPYDEHSGHFLQLYMGSQVNDLVPDAGLIRTNTDNGFYISNDPGHIKFYWGFPFTSAGWHNSVNINHDTLQLVGNKNNPLLDSVLTTDVDGNAILQYAYKPAKIDSLLNLKVNISDTASMLSSYVPRQELKDTAAAIRADMGSGSVLSVTGSPSGLVDNTDPSNPVVQEDALKLNISDTASMLSPYQRKADSTITYAKYPIWADGDTLKLRTDSLPKLTYGAGVDTSTISGSDLPTADWVLARVGSGTDSASYHSVTPNADSTGFILSRPDGTKDTVLFTSYYVPAIDSIWRTAGIDSFYWEKEGVVHSVKDSVGVSAVQLGDSLNNYQDFVSLATLTDAATITWDYATQSREAKVTLGGNRALSITNLPAGRVVYLTLSVIQDGTGSRTLSLPAGTKVINGGGGAVVLTTTAGAIDILSFRWTGSTLYCTYGKNYN